MRKIIITLILSLFYYLSSCQSQKRDTLIFRDKTKIKVFVVSRSIAYVRYVFPDDTVIHESRTRIIKTLKYARPTRGCDDIPVSNVHYQL